MKPPEGPQGKRPKRVGRYEAPGGIIEVYSPENGTLMTRTFPVVGGTQYFDTKGVLAYVEFPDGRKKFYDTEGKVTTYLDKEGGNLPINPSEAASATAETIVNPEKETGKIQPHKETTRINTPEPNQPVDNEAKKPENVKEQIDYLEKAIDIIEASLTFYRKKLEQEKAGEGKEKDEAETIFKIEGREGNEIERISKIIELLEKNPKEFLIETRKGKERVLETIVGGHEKKGEIAIGLAGSGDEKINEHQKQIKEYQKMIDALEALG